jgi:hypothetical protein
LDGYGGGRQESRRCRRVGERRESKQMRRREGDKRDIEEIREIKRLGDQG